MEKRGEIKAYNTKIIITPSVKEIWIYEEPVIYRASKNEKEEQINYLKTETKIKKQCEEYSALEQYDSLKRKQKHYEQMRWEISRLVDCNFDHKTKFLTLTFKENITDIQYANDELKKFLKRLNYFFYHTKKQSLKYIATWEKQKRGSIHYHIIFFSFPYIKADKLEKIWEHGFIKINRINVDSKENRGRYVSKYFSKDLELKEHKKKAFFTSQNLKKPIVKKLALTPEQIKAFETETIIYSKEYERKTYISEIFRSTEQPEQYLKDTNVRYLKIKNE